MGREREGRSHRRSALPLQMAAETLVHGLARLLQDAGEWRPARVPLGRPGVKALVWGQQRSRPGPAFPFPAGDLVLDGSSTLTLLTPTLQHLTQVFEQHLGSRNQNRGFVALPSHPAETAAILQAQFLFDVLQKTHSLKVRTCWGWGCCKAGQWQWQTQLPVSEWPPLVPIYPVLRVCCVGLAAPTGLLRGVVVQHDSVWLLPLGSAMQLSRKFCRVKNRASRS